MASIAAYVGKHKILTFLILNEVRGIIMTAPAWYMLIKHWMHHG